MNNSKKEKLGVLVLIITLALIMPIQASVNDLTPLVENTYRYQTSLYYIEADRSSVDVRIEKMLGVLMRKLSLKVVLASNVSQIESHYVRFKLASNNSAVPSIEKIIKFNAEPGQNIYEIGFEFTEEEYNTFVYQYNLESQYSILFQHDLKNVFSVNLIGYGDYQIVGETYVNNTNGVKTSSITLDLNPYIYDYYIAFQYARTSYLAGFDLQAADATTSKEYFRLKFGVGEKLSDPELMQQVGYGNTARVMKQKLQIPTPTTVKLNAEVFSSGWGAGRIAIVRTPIPRSVSAAVLNENIGENTPATVRVDIQKLPTDTVVIRDANTGTIYYQNSSLTGTADITFQLPVSARDYVLNVNLEAGGVAVVTKQCTINKREVLTVASTQMSLSAGQSSIMVITDGPRYYEDNALNRALVQEILKKGKGIYFISSYISPVLQPLLK